MMAAEQTVAYLQIDWDAKNDAISQFSIFDF